MRFVNSSFYSWFLVLVLSAGFCLGFTVSADAQLPEDVILEKTFNLDRWKRQTPYNVTVYYGTDPLLDADFTYKGTQYKVYSISSSYPRNRVKIGITPKFPPEGSHRSYFNLYAGSTSGELTKFNFGDANDDNEWPGHAGFREGYIENDDRTQNGRVQITVVDESIGEHVVFDSFYPKSTENSSGQKIGHRIRVVSDLNYDADTRVWRICDRGGNFDFGEEEARVACRQMGFSPGGARAVDLSEMVKAEWPLLFPSSGTPDENDPQTIIDAWLYSFQALSVYHTPVLLDKIQCEGDEEKLVDCSHLGLGVVSETCPALDTAGVLCE